jgi:hypothetical protein
MPQDLAVASLKVAGILQIVPSSMQNVPQDQAVISLKVAGIP